MQDRLGPLKWIQHHLWGLLYLSFRRGECTMCVSTMEEKQLLPLGSGAGNISRDSGSVTYTTSLPRDHIISSLYINQEIPVTADH